MHKLHTPMHKSPLYTPIHKPLAKSVGLVTLTNTRLAVFLAVTKLNMNFLPWYSSMSAYAYGFIWI